MKSGAKFAFDGKWTLCFFICRFAIDQEDRPGILFSVKNWKSINTKAPNGGRWLIEHCAKLNQGPFIRMKSPDLGKLSKTEVGDDLGTVSTLRTEGTELHGFSPVVGKETILGNGMTDCVGPQAVRYPWATVPWRWVLGFRKT